MSGNIVSEYRCISGDEITSEHLIAASKIDTYHYPKQYQMSAKSCLEWHSKNKNMFHILINTKTNDVIGYLNASPLTDDCIDGIMTGKMYDSQVVDSDILTYEVKGEYSLYIASVALNPVYMGKTCTKLLIKSLCNGVKSLADKDIFIKTMHADALTGKGASLCRNIGMSLLDKTNHGSTAYKMDLFSNRDNAKNEIESIINKILDKC